MVPWFRLQGLTAGAWVRSLVGELRFPKLDGTPPPKKKEEQASVKRTSVSPEDKMTKP